jgi:hypothetical protein
MVLKRIKKHFKKAALLFAAITLEVSIHAQVTIGIDRIPEEGAALEIRSKDMVKDLPTDLADVENSDRGILFPKVKLVACNSLEPLYTGVPTTVEKLEATGMVVYNIAAVDGIKTGLVQWNGSEWIQIALSSGLASISCGATTQDPIRINGYYTKNVGIISMSCVMIVPVQVSKTGAYRARAVVREGNTVQEAAFSFSGSGEFTQTGLNYITLTGHGMPVNSTEDNGGIENATELYINEKQLACTMPSIYVREKEAVFSFDCGTMRLFCSNGKNSIPKGQAINPNDVKIMMRITSTTPGAEYYIETDSINGVKFSGNGILNAGINTVTLEGRGTPVKSGTYTYTISGNNVNQTVTCTAELNVEYDNIKVLLISNNSGQWFTNDVNGVIPQLLQADSLFDFGNCPVAPFHIKSKSSIVKEHMNSSNLDYDAIKDYHLIIMSYYIVPSQNMAKALCEYVKTGKTCLLTCDQGNSSRVRMSEIIHKLSYNADRPTNIDYTSSTGTGDDAFKLLGGNLTVNGKYMDLTGKHIGRDGGGNFLFKDLPDDWIVLASNSATDPRNNANLIMHKKYRMFLAGDGGIFTGGNSSFTWYTNENNHAAWVNSNGMPIPCTKRPWRETPAYNAHFLANLLIWAFEAASE